MSGGAFACPSQADASCRVTSAGGLRHAAAKGSDPRADDASNNACGQTQYEPENNDYHVFSGAISEENGTEEAELGG